MCNLFPNCMVPTPFLQSTSHTTSSAYSTKSLPAWGGVNDTFPNSTDDPFSLVPTYKCERGLSTITTSMNQVARVNVHPCLYHIKLRNCHGVYFWKNLIQNLVYKKSIYFMGDNFLIRTTTIEERFCLPGKVDTPNTGQ
jgi:hypothetical protein